MKKVIVLAILIEFCRPDPAGKLLIVSFDGFGGGFLSRVDTPNIYELIKKSAYKERILNVFPTQTFPNHFSIATGLYAEEHGVLGSTVMDGGQILHYGYKMFHYNDNIIPIWTLNEMAVGSRHSGCCMWPGCDLQYNGVGTTYNIPFNLSTPWPERIETSLSWFTNQAKPANLVMMYFESPDFEEHIYGPNSNQTKDKIRKADEYVGRILAGLKSRGLNDVNVVVLSDHGMEGVPMSHLINVTDILNQRGRSVGTTPVLQIFPDAGKHDDLYSRLIALSKNTSHFDVYLKEEIPDRYRIKNCTRAPPILAVARPGYALLDVEYSKWLKDVTSKHKRVLSSSSELGFHGYDPELQSMQPFLIAYGPQFPKDFVLPNRTVGLYKVFKGVLRIDSFKRIPKSTFVGSSSLEPGRLTTFHQISFIIGGPLIGLIAVVIMFVLFRKRYSARNMGYTLVEKEESGV